MLCKKPPGPGDREVFPFRGPCRGGRGRPAGGYLIAAAVAAAAAGVAVAVADGIAAAVAAADDADSAPEEGAASTTTHRRCLPKRIAEHQLQGILCRAASRGAASWGFFFKERRKDLRRAGAPRIRRWAPGRRTGPGAGCRQGCQGWDREAPRAVSSVPFSWRIPSSRVVWRAAEKTIRLSRLYAGPALPRRQSGPSHIRNFPACGAPDSRCSL